MIKNKTYLDIKEILKDVIVPSNSDLIVLKLKEVFQIDSSDINIETIKSETIYTIRYEDVQVDLRVDNISRKFIPSIHFNVYDEMDNIIESY